MLDWGAKLTSPGQTATRKSSIFVLVRGLAGFSTVPIYFSGIPPRGQYCLRLWTAASTAAFECAFRRVCAGPRPSARKIELQNTIDVSRGGLLVSTKERHAPGVTVWVTFPHDASLSMANRRFRARSCAVTKYWELSVLPTRVREFHPANTSEAGTLPRNWINLRVPAAFSDAPATFAVAFQFESPAELFLEWPRAASESERRNRVRKALAIPIRVHPEQIPWFEEAMTLDISEKACASKPARICVRRSLENRVRESIRPRLGTVTVNSFPKLCALLPHLQRRPRSQCFPVGLNERELPAAFGLFT